MDYPIILERDDNNTVLVSFPDFPEAHTFGDDEADALRHASNALATVIDAYIKDRRDIPLPSALVTRHRLTMPALVEAKVRLYETMRAARVNKSQLAKRLHWHPPQVDRLLEMTHASRLEQLEAAFGVLGKRLVLNVLDIAEPAARRRQPAFKGRGERTAGAREKRRRSRRRK